MIGEPPAGKPVKVLHIGAGNLFGGIETILISLAAYRRYCPAMEVEFAVLYEGRLADELRKAGAVVHVLGAARFSRPWSILKVRHAMSALLERRAIDVAVCHAAWPFAIFAGTIARLKKKKVLWMHNPSDGRHWSERLARWNRPDFILSVSRDTDAATERLFPDVPHCVFYTPLPESTVAKAAQSSATNLRAEFGTAQDSVVIVQASRMEAWKGHVQHLEALSRIADLTNWECWIAGAPQRPQEEAYFSGVKARCGELGLNGRVRFLGQRSNVLDVLKSADIYCQPNTGPEGFSIVFIEACLARLPIVTSALGGALEIVDAESGMLSKPGDVEAVAQALRTLIGDAALRKRMGGVAHDRVWKMCDPATQINALQGILAKVCG